MSEGKRKPFSRLLRRYRHFISLALWTVAAVAAFAFRANELENAFGLMLLFVALTFDFFSQPKWRESWRQRKGFMFYGYLLSVTLFLLLAIGSILLWLRIL